MLRNAPWLASLYALMSERGLALFPFILILAWLCVRAPAGAQAATAP